MLLERALLLLLLLLLLGRGATAEDETPPAVHATIPPVLDCVVTASVKLPGDICPPLAHLRDQTLDLKTFFGADGLVVERGLQVLVVPFSTLFWRARAD